MQELFEVPEERLDKVRELRLRILEAEKNTDFHGVVFSRKDSRFLLRFLRARKFQVDRALQLYLNYYKYRHKHSHLLGDLSLQSVQHVLQRGFFALLDTPSKCGSRTIVVFPARSLSLSLSLCFNGEHGGISQSGPGEDPSCGLPQGPSAGTRGSD